MTTKPTDAAGNAETNANKEKIENGIKFILETDKERVERTWSLWIVYFTMFLMSLGFSIVLTGVWPFLDSLDHNAGKEFMGLVIAANPLGSMIFSPIFGWWSNKVSSIRFPMLVSLVIFCLSSGLYSTLDLLKDSTILGVKYWMFIARFLVGVSGANMAVCNSYLSAATTLKERTMSVSILSFAQVLGFVVGPALQSAVTPLGTEGFEFYGLKINMYTATGWSNVLLGSINFILFLPYFFKDHKIAAKEQMMLQGKATEKETWKSTKTDYATSWTLILSFFVIVFNFVLLETIGTPLTMDQFAWTKKQAVNYFGIIMSCGAAVACVGFLFIGPLCKRFRESNVLIWGGFFLMVVARVVIMPYRNEYPKLAIDQEYKLENGSIAFYDEDDPAVLGCPFLKQPWCETTPVLGIPEFILGFILSTLSYPIGVSLIQTIFSKILGSRPQGVWMGLMAAAGCVSRVFGPIAVGSIYSRYGTAWIFGITGVMMVIPMVWLYILRDRLDVEVVDLKTVEMKNLKESSLIRDKAVIINENGGEQESFLLNGK